MAIVFLTDRDEPYRKALAHALRQRGVETAEFTSGSELYADVLAGAPDLVVMDTDLDEMDGFQVFVRLQRSQPSRKFPIVFVTAFDHPRVARACKQRGALAYFGKSGSPEQLAATLHSLLTDEDPLYERTLPGALAWLQSRGKSGRLEVEARGQHGYILLHNGKVLDARWKLLRGDEAVALFAEGLPGASFRFAEGADETDVPQPEESGWEVAADGAGRAEAGPAVREPATPSILAGMSEWAADQPHGAVPVAAEEAAAAAPTDVPLVLEDATASEGAPALVASDLLAPGPPEPGHDRGRTSAVAAARELWLEERERTRAREARRRGSRFVAAGIAAALVLLVGLGVALSAFYPGYVPAALSGILSGLGVSPAQRQVEEPVPQFARTGGDEAVRGEDEAGAEELAAAGGGGLEPATASRRDVAVAPPSPAPAVDESSPAAAVRDEPVAEPSARLREEEREARGARAAEERRVAAVTEGPRAREARPSPVVAPPPATEPPRPTEESLPRERESAAIEPREAQSSDVTRPAPPPARVEPERAVLTEASPRETTTEPAARRPSVEPPPLVSATRPSRRTTGDEPSPVLVQRPVLLQRGSDPYYPPELKAQGVGGSVVLNIRVGTNGRAQRVEVLRSSGYEAFDQAAVAAVGTFLWEPARSAAGPAETWITQAVTFRP